MKAAALLALALVVGLLSIQASAVAGVPADQRLLRATGSTVASCEHSMRGVGIPLDQAPTDRLGPFGIFEFTPDFRDLPRFGNANLREKAPVGVTGATTVTLTVPERARDRVALVYAGGKGRWAEVEFQPCPGKQRTAWPGGLILRDRQPVTLSVTVGAGVARPLRLGR